MASGLLQRASRLLYWLIVFQVGAMAFVVNLQIFNRYVVNYVFGWEEETARYLMVWSAFLAAAYALWEGEQLGMEALLRVLPPGIRRAVRGICHLAVMAFLAVVAYQAFVHMLPQQLDQVSPSLGITMAIPYAAIPVSAVLMLGVEAALFWRDVRGAGSAPTETAPLEL